MAAVGPEGQSLFEYSVHDAVSAGFNHIVFVVSDHQDTAEFSSRLQGYGSALKVEFVVQSLTAYTTHIDQSHKAAGKAHCIDTSFTVRAKPWGTAHALLVCREYINNPFVVINADDYHGRGNYRVIGRYLIEHQHNPKTCVLAGYRLQNTLSRSGGVNRGICEIDFNGYLKSIHEVSNISRDQLYGSPVDCTSVKRPISKDTIVSMTFWGFLPSVFNLLDNEFQNFLNDTDDFLEDEFYIPDTVNKGVKSGLLEAMVFETSEVWKGLTYAEDLPTVRDYITKLSETGLYSNIGAS